VHFSNANEVCKQNEALLQAAQKICPAHAANFGLTAILVLGDNAEKRAVGLSAVTFPAFL